MSKKKDQKPAPERRKRERREKTNRRELVRFEPDKTPRRGGNNRRKSTDIWKDRDKT